MSARKQVRVVNARIDDLTDPDLIHIVELATALSRTAAKAPTHEIATRIMLQQVIAAMLGAIDQEDGEAFEKSLAEARKLAGEIPDYPAQPIFDALVEYKNA